MLDGMAGDLLFFSAETSLRLLLQTWDIRGVLSDLRAQRRHGDRNGWRMLMRLLAAEALPRAVVQFLRRGRARFRVSDDARILRPELRRMYGVTEDERAERRPSGPAGKAEFVLRSHARTFMASRMARAHEAFGGMAFECGVEPRGPFSDRRLVEYAIRMPLRCKTLSPMYKPTLRHAMRGELPDAVLNRRNIGGHPGWRFYSSLIEGLFEHEPASCAKAKVSDQLRTWVEPKTIEAYWERYQSVRDYDSGYRLLHCMILSEWLESKFGARA